LRSDDEMAFPKLAAPARRALSAAGYTRLDQLAQVSESDLTKLHGMGTTAIAALREALHERGLSFHAGVPASDHLQGVAGSPGEVDEYLRGVEEPGSQHASGPAADDPRDRPGRGTSDLLPRSGFPGTR
jgi:hypothetical protein